MCRKKKQTNKRKQNKTKKNENQLKKIEKHKIIIKSRNIRC